MSPTTFDVEIGGIAAGAGQSADQFFAMITGIKPITGEADDQEFDIDGLEKSVS